MSRFVFPLRFALLALVACLAAPGVAQAQQPTQDLVPFKAIVKSATPPTPFILPYDPPVAVFSYSLIGEADFLGPVTFLQSDRVTLAVDGSPLIADGIGAFVAANGEALFLKFSGLARATATGVACDHHVVITGGKGRFLGAFGTGTMKGEGNAATGEIVLTFDLMISRPRPTQ